MAGFENYFEFSEEVLRFQHSPTIVAKRISDFLYQRYKSGEIKGTTKIICHYVDCIIELHYKNEFLHDDYGPSYIKYNKNNKVVEEWYTLFGEHFLYEEWLDNEDRQVRENGLELFF